MLRHVLRLSAGMLGLVVLAGLLVHAQTTPTTPTTPPPDPADPFFDDSKVHSISIVINSRDWQSLKDHYLDNTYYQCDFKWNDITVRNIGIRSRGTGSRSGVKPGLRVDFDRYVTSQKFKELKSFILRNQTQDASNMHERLSMLLFKRLGVKVSREAFTKLFVNNAYEGLYTIVESVDKTFLKKSFDEDGGTLYKYDYNADDQPWYFTDKGPNQDSYVPHPFKPETNENDPQPQAIVDWVRSVASDSDAAFPTNIAKFVDWDNFTRHIAVEEVISDQDGFNGDYGINNFYLYNLKDKQKFKFIPWDKSEAFKNPVTLGLFHNFLDGVPDKRNRLSARAMTVKNPDVQNMYLDRLVDASKSLAELDPDNPLDKRGWMEREIQKEYDLIHDLVYSDTLKPFTNEQFEEEVERLRTFARERPAFVQKAVLDFRGH